MRHFFFAWGFPPLLSKHHHSRSDPHSDPVVTVGDFHQWGLPRHHAFPGQSPLCYALPPRPGLHLQRLRRMAELRAAARCGRPGRYDGPAGRRLRCAVRPHRDGGPRRRDERPPAGRSGIFSSRCFRMFLLLLFTVVVCCCCCCCYCYFFKNKESQDIFQSVKVIFRLFKALFFRAVQGQPGHQTNFSNHVPKSKRPNIFGF